MHWQTTPYWPFFLVAITLSGLVAVFSFRRRNQAGAAKPFALLMVIITYWILGYAAELSGANTHTILLGLKASYIGVVATPVFMLVFVLHYIGRDDWLTFRNSILLAIIPLVTLALNWTSGLHPYYYSSLDLDTSGPYVVLNTHPGVWYWFHIAYSYLLLLISTSLLVVKFLRSTRVYRVQIGVILFGALFPWVGSILDVFVNPFPYLNLAPLSFVITGMLISLGLFRFRLLDIVPVARNTLVNHMPDGMVVLDLQNRVVDINPAMEAMIGVLSKDVVGHEAAKVLLNWPELAEFIHDHHLEANPEIMLERSGERYHFDLCITPLTDRKGKLGGRLFVLRDITDRVMAEAA